MDHSETINNKILEERQIEKFSSFIESYEADVGKIRSRLKTSGNSKIQAGTEELESLIREGSTNLLYPLLTLSQVDKDQDSRRAAGRLLPHLQHLDNYVDHSRDVVENLLSQLAVILSSTSPVKLSPGRLAAVWETLARLLSTLAMLDVVVTEQVIQQHWLEYKRMVKGLRNEPEKFGSSIEAVRQLEKVLLDLEKTVMTGNMIQSVLGMKVEVNKALVEEMTMFVRQLASEVDREPGSISTKFLSLCCLAAVLRKLSGQHDRKIVSKLWETIKKLPGCGIVSEAGVTWTPETFFQRFLSQAADSQTSQEKKYEASTENARKSWFSSKLSSLTGEVRALLTEVAGWRARMAARLGREESSLSNLQLPEMTERTQLILAGVALAETCKLQLNSCFNFFLKFEQPLTKSVIASLGELMAAIKMIQETFRSVTGAMTEVCLRSGQHAQFLVLNMIQGLKKGLVSDRKLSDERIDILSCLLIAEKALAGPVTRQRISVATVALTLAAGGRFGVREEDCRQMLQQISVLDKLVNINEEIQRSCSTHFLSVLDKSHLEIISVILQDLFSRKKAENLPFLVGALQNFANVQHHAKHFRSKTRLELLQMVQDAVTSALELEIITPLCKEIETELRLSVHQQAGLQLDDRNPFRKTPVELQPFLQLEPLNILGGRVSVKQRVENYMERTFYNLTTVSLHNWKTYGEMRQTAGFRLGLDTVEDHLPSQTVEQGLDVLEMMRNIQVFTSGYNYNMNSQVFVEQTSNSKHLNTISIRHIANSIRTHGSGIINTTVNFTYQFLRKKFVVFSQFLYDEHIKSRLSKDFKYFKENKTALDQKYPLDRAAKFNRAIRKLGLMPDGVSTYLDQFRLLITHIGNAMGFVRMVRSGGIQRTSLAIRFVPDIEDIQTFADLASNENLSPETQKVAEALDATLENLSSNLTNSNEYFNILVQVFTHQLNDEKQTHLNHFFLILPPLTVNYVEHITAAKEKIFKKNIDGGAAFTDDGFSMGLAYCLTLLDQWKQADSLHWFESVESNLNLEKQEVERKRATEKDEKLQNTLTLKLKRIETTLKEFQLLHFNVNSARIFFQADDTTSAEDDAKSTISAGNLSARE